MQRDNPSATDFLGYGQSECDVETFCYLYRTTESACERVDKVETGDELAVVVGHTPFYAEAGGQAGDTGTIKNTHGGVFRVRDTVKVGSVHFHFGTVEAGELRESPPTATDMGVELKLKVDQPRRRAIIGNHTGTHLMNRALRDVLGDHVQQKGSLVDDEKLRFDFSHNTPINSDEIDRIEQMVNADIAGDLPVYAEDADQEAALKINSLRAVFGEKYPPRVRMVSIGVPVADLLAKPDSPEWLQYSIEFCGGTHLSKTGDAEGFVIVSEDAVAKGVRRLTALTGRIAHKAAAEGEMLLARLESLQGSAPDALSAAITGLSEELNTRLLPLSAKTKLRTGIEKLQAALKEHEKKKGKAAAGQAIEKARQIADEAQGDVIVTSLDGADANGLRAAADVIRKKLPDTAMLLAGTNGQNIAFVAAVPKAMIEKGLKAGDWVKQAAKMAGGGGGGRPDMAQAGGKNRKNLKKHLTPRGLTRSRPLDN